jgi:integrase
MTNLTEMSLRAATPRATQYELTDANKRGEGALVVRVKPTGARVFFYRYFVDGKRTYIQIGRHQHVVNDGGLTLKEARQKAATLKDDLRDHGDPKLKRLEQDRAIKEKRREIEIESRQGTFQQLIDAYVARLGADGKPSAHDTKITLDLHVTKAWPDLVRLKAKEITPEDISRILAAMIRKGITRRTNIVRAMLRAAFAHGAKSDLDPRRIAAEGVKFGLSSNPVAIVPRQGDYDKASKRVLTDAELQHLWHNLDRNSPTLRNTLRLALLFGGQRLTQLTRAEWTDYDEAAGVLRLRDAKGRGGERAHLLPVSKWAASLLAEIPRDHTLIFATTRGTAITVEHMSGIVRTVAQDAESDYRLGDLRRTAETRLASLGVDREIRAQLLSHGRESGVQAKHYDQFEYLPQKRDALALWEAHLQKVLEKQELLAA